MTATTQAIQIVRGIVGLINNQDLTIAGLEKLANELKAENTNTKAQLSQTISTYEAAIEALKVEFEQRFAADEADDEANLQAEQAKVAELEGDLAETMSEKEALEAQNAELASEVEALKAVLDRITQPEPPADEETPSDPVDEAPVEESPDPVDAPVVDEPSSEEPSEEMPIE